MKAWGAALWALMGLVASAEAQNTTVYLDQGQIVRTNQNVTTLGADLMGDKVNLYSGELEFVQTDVSLPGNNALPVAVGRRYEANKYAGATSGGQFSDWDLEIPHLYGVFAGAPAVYKGWTVWNSAVGKVNASRCTAFGPPVDAARTGASDAWDPDQFWNGHFLYVPGVSNERLLQRDAAFTSKPSDGNTYGVVTKSNWQLRCLTAGLKVDGVAATGDGFIAVAPDGTTYRFDWMVSRWYQPLSGSPGSLSRLEHWILPTLVTNRFGNTVTYTYDTTNAWQLKSIVASDGRALNLTYVSGTNRVATVSDGSRTWTYAYSSTSPYKLTSLTLPDGSAWQFSMAEQQTKSDQRFVMNPLPTCSASNVWTEGTIVPTPLTSSITHPSGAVGSFSMSWVAHGRTFPQSTAYNPCPLSQSVSNQITPVYPVRSLTSKTLSGPGLTSSVWSYGWGPANGNWYCNGCNATKTLTVTDPRSVQSRYTFSNRFQSTEGQLLQVDEGWNGSSALRTTVNTYRAFGAGPYPATVGSSGRADDGYQTSFLPLSQRTTTQQGVNFTWQATAFDTLARPTSVTRSGTATRTETTVYADNTAKWVLGQIASVTESSTGAVMVSNTYDASTANLLSTSAFGQLQQSFSYYADGTLYKRFDPAGRATTFSNYKRGLAQNVAYPNSTAESAVVNDIGLVTSVTDPNGYITAYGYDAIGRLNLITRPTGDTVAWNATSLAFAPIASAEYDLPAGHWRQTVSTGNARKVTYFDALWRPVLTKTFDTANPGATGNDMLRRFDADGRATFESYPTRGITSVNANVAGATTTYDALGRATQTVAGSELGNLTTSTAYVGGFQRHVTDPRNQVTTSSFQAFDQPTEAAVSSITAPEGVNVSIPRDVFGKPTAITRSGAYGGSTLSATRRYVYDSAQRLCKTIEPETGAALQDYDGANNVAWRAPGTTLTGITCDRASVAAASKTSFGYDTLNRLTSTSYGDGSPSVSRSYTPDGLLNTVNSNNLNWSYGYNRRRLLTQESLVQPTGTWGLSRGYDANGSASQITYPDGAAIAFNPNALGQPTTVGSYASAVSWHPNGAVGSYTLGNNIAHTLTQNTRGLPLVNRDAGVMQDSYAFDANANVASITDQQESVTTRSMSYDGLDRLKTANALNLWGNGSYTYDPLDNLRTSTVGSTNITRSYDAANRLSQLNTNGSLTGIAYDARGNVTGRGSQGYSFDQANRMTLANGIANYTYDGHGRRVSVIGNNGINKTHLYSQSGQLLFGKVQQGMTTWSTRYVYLGDKLIAETTNNVTEYAHTDALGSPVARTNASGGLISRTRYEPYGKTAGGTNPGATGLTGIGFTGHVNDAETALVYMQQRYYDPVAGRFLSNDPVGADANVGNSFNRYYYGNNNPYRYTDPDGRVSWDEVKSGMSKWWDNSVAGFRSASFGQTAGQVIGAMGPGVAAIGAAGSIVKAEAAIAAKVEAGVAKEITLSRSIHGEAAAHAADAIEAGKPSVLTIERGGAAVNRQASTGALDKVNGKHLDEYPPAMFREGGLGASVRPISPRDNMSAGACIGNACRGLPDGSRVQIKIGD